MMDTQRYLFIVVGHGNLIRPAKLKFVVGGKVMGKTEFSYWKEICGNLFSTFDD